jgi:hypothetical protein
MERDVRRQISTTFNAPSVGCTNILHLRHPGITVLTAKLATANTEATFWPCVTIVLRHMWNPTVYVDVQNSSSANRAPELPARLRWPPRSDPPGGRLARLQSTEHSTSDSVNVGRAGRSSRLHDRLDFWAFDILKRNTKHQFPATFESPCNARQEL